MKPLLVGEANPYGADPAFALYPLPERSSGDRLCRLVMGLERREYLRRFDRVNLCPQRWSMPLARRNALRIMLDEKVTPVVLLGAKVCAAFSLKFEPFTVKRSESDTGTQVYVTLPHPSGLSRAWNEENAFLRARTVLIEGGVLL